MKRLYQVQETISDHHLSSYFTLWMLWESEPVTSTSTVITSTADLLPSVTASPRLRAFKLFKQPALLWVFNLSHHILTQSSFQDVLTITLIIARTTQAGLSQLPIVLAGLLIMNICSSCWRRRICGIFRASIPPAWMQFWDTNVKFSLTICAYILTRYL